MAEDPAVPGGHTLLVSYLYPSCHGWGTQLRAAALLRMLAARGGVSLLLLSRVPLSGPRDQETEALCRRVFQLRIRAEDEPRLADGVLDGRECLPSGVVEAVQAFAREERADTLFVFRPETCFLLEGALDSFSRRLLDLDESACRRNEGIDRLREQAGEAAPDPARRRAHVVARILEQKMLGRFDRVFVSSPDEARHASALCPEVRVHVLPNIMPLPAQTPPPPPAGPPEILFVGTLSYYPNEDAARFFAREIFPRIHAALGGAVRFRIVGQSCPPRVQALAALPGVEVAGFLPDLDEAYARASLAVVPLRAGTGTRLKILEAFGRGRPVVSTSIGAEGLEVADGRELLLRDGPEAFAQGCLEILRNPALAARLAEGGSRRVRESYTPERLLACYDAALSAVPAP